MRLLDAPDLALGQRRVSEVFQGGVERYRLPRLIKQLYGNSEQGAFYVPRPQVLGEQVLWQDAAGTVPVVDDGDPVGLMLDLSGNGNHASQSVSGARPIYRTGGGLHWLEFDGVDDNMTLVSNRQAYIDETTSLFAKGFSDGGDNEPRSMFSVDNESGKIFSRASSYWWLEIENNLTNMAAGVVESSPVAAMRSSVSGSTSNALFAHVDFSSAVTIENSSGVSSSRSVSSPPRDEGGGANRFYSGELFCLLFVHKDVSESLKESVFDYMVNL